MFFIFVERVFVGSFFLPGPRNNFNSQLLKWSSLWATPIVPSSWATKVSTIGQQALFGAEGAEESQGHKALGIHRPCAI